MKIIISHALLAASSKTNVAIAQALGFPSEVVRKMDVTSSDMPEVRRKHFSVLHGVAESVEPVTVIYISDEIIIRAQRMYVQIAGVIGALISLFKANAPMLESEMKSIERMFEEE